MSRTARRTIDLLQNYPLRMNVHFHWLKSKKIIKNFNKISSQHGFEDKFESLKKSMIFIDDLYTNMIKTSANLSEANLPNFFEQFKCFILYLFSAIDVITFLYTRIFEKSNKPINIKKSFDTYHRAEYEAFLRGRINAEQEKLIPKYEIAILNIIRNRYSHSDSPVKVLFHEKEPKICFEFNPSSDKIKGYFTPKIQKILLEDYSTLKKEFPKKNIKEFIPVRQSIILNTGIPIVCTYSNSSQKIIKISFGSDVLRIINSFIIYFLNYIRAFIKCCTGDEFRDP